MNWYKIVPCPNYAISEDGQQVKNIITNQIIKHNTAPYAKDGLRRITLWRKVVYHNKVRSAPKVYNIISLKEFIKEENKLNI